MKLKHIIGLIVLATICSCMEPADIDWYFAGDSHVEYWDTEYYFPFRQINNEGKAGDRVQGLITRLQELELIQANNSQVIIEIGTNNLLNAINDGMSDDQIMDMMSPLYDDLFSTIEAKFSGAYILSVFPTRPEVSDSRSSELYSRINDLIKNTVATYNEIEYLNMFDELKEANSNYLALKYSSDGLHLNELGYSVISNKLRTYVR